MPASDPRVSGALTDRLRARLEALQRAGLKRSLRPPEGIDLCSNDYLGLATHPLLKRRMAEAAEQAGCGSTGSRLLRGESECLSALEVRFARFKGAGRALYFSSGYLANLAVLSTFPEPGDVIYSDQFNHASLIDGMRLSKARRVLFPHNNAARLTRLMEADGSAGQRFIVVESHFSMEGDFAPLAAYAELCRKTGAALIVDEAHATGIYGATGSGLLEETGAGAFLSINTAGKALGVAGAFVAGSDTAIEYLLQRARTLMFSTAAPPPVAAALHASLDVIAAEPERRRRVRNLARYLRARLREAGFEVAGTDSVIVPVVLGGNQTAVRVAAALQAAGLDVRAVRPPTVPEGTARLRVSVHCGLTEELLDRFVAQLDQACAASS